VLLGVELAEVLDNVGILALERHIRRVGSVDNRSRVIVRGHGLRIVEMAIALPTRQDLIAGLALQGGVLVDDVVVVWLHSREATGDDFVVDSDDGVLGDVLCLLVFFFFLFFFFFSL
jgi:hypothetical protein